LSSGVTSFFGRRREWTEAEVEAELSPPLPQKNRPKNPGVHVLKTFYLMNSRKKDRVFARFFK
jgi:hypothetical protein